MVSNIFICTPPWWNDPIWLIFFKWVETTNYKRCFKLFNKKTGENGIVCTVLTDRTASPAPQHLTIVLFALWGHGSCWKFLTYPCRWLGLRWNENGHLSVFSYEVAKNLYLSLFFIRNFVTSGLEITMQSAWCTASQGHMQWRPERGLPGRPGDFRAPFISGTGVSEVRVHG